MDFLQELGDSWCWWMTTRSSRSSTPTTLCLLAEPDYSSLYANKIENMSHGHTQKSMTKQGFSPRLPPRKSA
ncbi:MAG: hypothetical protein ACLU9S_24100 [Oscillospiraceae bacterium]